MINTAMIKAIDAEVEYLRRTYEDMRYTGIDAARAVREDIVKSYDQDTMHKYMIASNRNSIGSFLYRGFRFFSIESFIGLDDSSIYDRLKDNFWHICVMETNLLNFFGLGIEGPLYAIYKSVETTERNIHLGLGSDLNLYPDINAKYSDEELANEVRSVKEGKTLNPSYKPDNPLGLEMNLIFSSLSAIDSLRNQYYNLIYMFREIEALESVQKHTSQIAITKAQDSRRALWMLSYRLKGFYGKYETNPEYFSIAYDSVYTILKLLESNRKSEIRIYQHLLQELLFGDVPKDKAIEILNNGNFFSRLRMEGTAINKLKESICPESRLPTNQSSIWYPRAYGSRLAVQ